MLKTSRILCPLLGLLMFATITCAGGTAPGDEAPQEPIVRGKVTASPAQTSAAVSKARQAVSTPEKSVMPAKTVVPTIKEVPMSMAQPKASSSVDKNSWLLSSREGECAPLSAASRKTGDIGTFNTPQEFAKKMQQRGHQAFVLDIGDVRDQVVRVKVPDMALDLTFARAGMCR